MNLESTFYVYLKLYFISEKLLHLSDMPNKNVFFPNIYKQYNFA